MEYKKVIIQLLDQLDESDFRFLKKLYIIIKKHMEKKGRH